MGGGGGQNYFHIQAIVVAPLNKLPLDGSLGHENVNGGSPSKRGEIRAQIINKALPGIRVRKPKNNALRNASIATFEDCCFQR